MNKAPIPFLLLATIWAALMILSPLMLPADSMDLGNHGVVGTEDFEEENSDIDNPLIRWVYVSGDLNCHQRASRSYFVNGNEMPYCARDFGLFVGMVIGLAIITAKDIKVSFWFMIASIVPLGLDGTVQMFTIYESTNLIRLITGTIAGVGMGAMIGYLSIEYYQLISKKQKGNKDTGHDIHDEIGDSSVSMSGPDIETSSRPSDKDPLTTSDEPSQGAEE